jgi:hypothetical protein
LAVILPELDATRVIPMGKDLPCGFHRGHVVVAK